MSRYGGVLRDRVTSRLLVAQSISELGDFVGITALVLLAYTSTGSVLGSAAVYGAHAALKVATATWGAGLLDRVPRRRALAGLSAAGALIVGCAAVVPNLWTALVASALLGACRTASYGVQAALLGEAVPAGLRGPALAVSGSINQGAQVGGILGGAAVSLAVGVGPALLADAVTFVVAAAVLLTLPVVAQRPAEVRPRPLDGVRAVLGQPTLRRLAPVAWTCMVASLLPETLAADAVPREWVAVAMAASPFGGVIGYLLVGRTTLLDTASGTLRAQVALGGVLITGAAVVWSAPSAATFVTVNVLVGLMAVAMLGVQTAFIAHSPPAQAAQINTTMVASVGVLEGAGSVLAGGVAALAGVPAAYLLIGLLVLGMALAALRRPSGVVVRPVPEPAAAPM
ncbi:MAG TPA: MFS transporter [Blastococcus sp.]|nr:MFS transporter [Blastococcus sp.]